VIFFIKLGNECVRLHFAVVKRYPGHYLQHITTHYIEWVWTWTHGPG